jgi:hypothetical protein
MAYTLIVEKEEARVVFIRDAHIPLLLDALWPPVGYNYLLWTGALTEDMLAKPWNYLVQGNKLVSSPYVAEVNAIENALRGGLLVQLARATNRHRRMVFKEDVIGQAEVYRLKTDEATRFLVNTEQNPNDFPWLSETAAFEGLTLEQSANQIMFRHTQSQAVLRHTENQRRWFTRRILTAGGNELETVRTELTAYERRG